MKPIVDYLLYASLLLFACLWLGCSTQKDALPTLKVTAQNSQGVESSRLSFDAEGGEFSINILSNSRWVVDKSAEWITFSATEGTGNAELRATVSQATEPRSAVITIRLKDYKQELFSISVVQHVKAPTETPDDPTPDDPTPDDEKTDSPDDNQNPSDDNHDSEEGNDENEDVGTEGDGGEEIDPDENNPDENNPEENPEENPEPDQPEVPTTKEPQPITIAELITLMTHEMQSVVIDGECDRVLTGVVMNDIEAMNYYPNHLILCAEGATEANQGVTLSGKLACPAELGLKMGDKVEVTLKAGLAVAIKYKGRYEITGEVGSEWMSLNRLSSATKITPLEVIPQQLLSYQAMTVKLNDVTPVTAGRWHSAENKGYTEFTSSDGATFRVFVESEALFSANEFHVACGQVVGIVTVIENEAVLCPRNLADVADFDGAPDVEDNENQDDSLEDDPEDTPENDTDEPENNDEIEGDNSDEENGQGGENEQDEPSADEPFTLVERVADLSEGRYYIGGYRESTLYLATGSLTEQNHCTTKSYKWADGQIVPLEEAEPAVVTLEKSDKENGYYIKFEGGKYLIANDNSAGALELTDERSHYWLFSDHADGGFELKQSGAIDVKLIISKRAKSDILRSVDGQESGGAVILIRIN